MSQVFPGSVSDRDMVVKSGLLNPQLWEAGDGLIKDYLTPLGVSLEI